LYGGSADAVDRTRGNRTQRVKVQLGVTDVNGGTTIEEERDQSRVDNGAFALVRHLIG
jgi:vacuolar-type H+-ATPase subunit E/Vma4